MKHFKSHSSLRDEEPMPVLLIVRHAVDEDLIGVGSLWDGCCWFAVAHGDVKVAFSYLQTEFDFRQCP